MVKFKVLGGASSKCTIRCISQKRSPSSTLQNIFSGTKYVTSFELTNSDFLYHHR